MKLPSLIQQDQSELSKPPTLLRTQSHANRRRRNKAGCSPTKRGKSRGIFRFILQVNASNLWLSPLPPPKTRRGVLSFLGGGVLRVLTQTKTEKRMFGRIWSSQCRRMLTAEQLSTILLVFPGEKRAVGGGSETFVP